LTADRHGHLTTAAAPAVCAARIACCRRDIRNCMVALAKDEALLSRLFQYRFQAGQRTDRPQFGNLFLARFACLRVISRKGSRFEQILAIRGRIFHPRFPTFTWSLRS